MIIISWLLYHGSLNGNKHLEVIIQMIYFYAILSKEVRKTMYIHECFV